jgi:hypothetical protein
VEDRGLTKWNQVAAQIPGRNQQQCETHWDELQNPFVPKRCAWTQEEDDTLVKVVSIQGPGQWAVVASHLRGRSGKQCRERWHNQLNPDICKEPWSEEEDRVIQEMQNKYGNRWAQVGVCVPRLVGLTWLWCADYFPLARTD